MKTKKKAPVSSAPTKHRKQKQIISKSTITREYNEYVKKENKVSIEIRRKYKNTEYLEEEVWVPLLEPERYYISSFGNVAKKLKSGKFVPVKIRIKGDGHRYFMVKRKGYPIHIMVARYFHSCGTGDRVIYINRDKSDNKPDNLIFCTKSEVTGGKPYLRMSRRKTQNEPILQFGLDGTFIKRWNNAEEVQNTYGFRKGDILFCAEGGVLTAYSFVWVFDRVDKGFDKFPIAKKKIEAIHPFIIKAYHNDVCYLCASIAEAGRISGLTPKEAFKLCYIKDKDAEWHFEYNGISYRKENVLWI